MPRPPRPPPAQTVNLNVTLGGGFTFAGEVIQKIVTEPAPSPPRAVFTATFGGFTATGENMSYTLPDEMMVYLQVGYVDAKGNPATVDGDTTWTSSHDDIAEVHVNPDDSTQAQVWGKGIGQAQITTSADADLGEGVRQILATLDINVVAGEAVTATITPSGEPQPIPVERSQTRRK
jgi:hypothetical protein